MYLADSYYDREAGDMIHKLLLIRDNYKFISRASIVWFFNLNIYIR